MQDDTEVRLGSAIRTGDLEIVFDNDLESIAAHMTLLREAIKRMQSIVRKLPKTADGISIVPGMVFFLIDDQAGQAKNMVRTIVITSLRNMTPMTAHARIDGAELALSLSDVFSSRKAADHTLAARALIKADIAKAKMIEATKVVSNRAGRAEATAEAKAAEAEAEAEAEAYVSDAEADMAEATKAARAMMKASEARQAQAQTGVLGVPQADTNDAQSDTAELRRDWLERSNRSEQPKQRKHLWKHQAAQQRRLEEVEAAEREAAEREDATAESEAKWRNEQ